MDLELAVKDKTMLSNQTKKKIVALHKQGNKIKSIAEELDLTYSQVHHCINAEKKKNKAVSKATRPMVEIEIGGATIKAPFFEIAEIDAVSFASLSTKGQVQVTIKEVSEGLIKGITIK
jgi:glutamyl/glutaminyl-tRNA synthetase